MSGETSNRPDGAIAMLRRMKQPKTVEERCDFCNVVIPPVHRHLLELGKRKIICSCAACAMRFEGVVGGRFKLVPRDARSLPDFHMTEAQWDQFALPINLVFVYRDSRAGKMVAMYPSPAGVTESLLQAQNWESLLVENPALETMQADVEALLVNRVGETREYFIAPIDVCYELVGLIRMHWRGFSGGEKVWEELEKFFVNLREKAEPALVKMTEAVHA